MNRNVLVTMAIGDYRRIGKDFTFPLMEKYAKKFGFDLFCIDRVTPGRMYSWEAMEYIHRLLDEYDRLFFVSVDCIIAPNARNVLWFPAETFYGFDEYPFDDAPLNEGTCKKIWEHAMSDWPDEFPKSTDVPRFLYNTGIMLVDKSHRPLFEPVSVETDHGMQDMSSVSMRIHKYKMKHQDMYPGVFNASHLWKTPERPDFLHVMWYPGTKYDGVKEFMPKMGYK